MANWLSLSVGDGTDWLVKSCCLSNGSHRRCLVLRLSSLTESGSLNNSVTHRPWDVQGTHVWTGNKLDILFSRHSKMALSYDGSAVTNGWTVSVRVERSVRITTDDCPWEAPESSCRVLIGLSELEPTVTSDVPFVQMALARPPKRLRQTDNNKSLNCAFVKSPYMSVWDMF